MGSRKLVLFHHLVKIGGSIYDENEVIFGFVHGLGKHSAFPMIPDLDTLGKEYTERAIPVPALNQIYGVSNVEDVEGLADSAVNRYRPRNFIPVPPFLVESIYKAIRDHDGDARFVLLEASKGIKEFNEVHVEDDNFTE